MISKKSLHLLVVLLALAGWSPQVPVAEELKAALIDQARWQLSTRMAIIDRKFVDTPAADRQQAGLGLILDYHSGNLPGGVAVRVAGYHLQKIWADGRKTADLLSADNSGNLDSWYSQIGEASLEWRWPGGFFWQIGRQRASSLQLQSSGQRALPDTYEGLSGQYQGQRIQFYGSWFNRWSPRNDNNFRSLGTDLSASAIDHLSILGFSFQHENIKLESEWLASSGYLKKYGLRGSYRWLLADATTTNQTVKLSGGYFVSVGHGRAFLVGAEADELDDEDGAAAGIPGRHRGEGGYLQAELENGPWRLTLVRSGFGNAWLEDNFAGDHGTNPFPTRSILYPDLTNTNEIAWQLALGYVWSGRLSGLSITTAHTRGTGAENSVDPRFGTGDESYRELLVAYRPPAIGGLSLQWRYQDYRGDIEGAVDGIKNDLKEHRIFLDYSHRF